MTDPTQNNEEKTVNYAKQMRDIMTAYYIDAKTAVRTIKRWRGSPAAARLNR